MYYTLYFPYKVETNESTDVYEIKLNRCKADISVEDYNNYHNNEGKESLAESIGVPLCDVIPIGGKEYEKLVDKKEDKDK